MRNSPIQNLALAVTPARLVSRLLGSVGLLTLALCLSSTAQADSITPKVYDLDSRHGVLVVYQRVQTIAEQHCVANTDLAQPLSSKERACRNRVLAQLLGKLADPYLSYLHENPEAQRLAER